MYKDAPDGDSSEEEDDQEMRGEQDSDAEGSENEDEYDSEEEIKEIPLKALAEKSMRKKRARLGQG